MQAIITKYISPTNTKSSRIKAECGRGSITIPFDHSGDIESAHVSAASALCAKFVSEDVKRYGSQKTTWQLPRHVGCLPSGEYAHVFTARS